ncbi:MAG: hypothetical protein RL171_2313 [Pseudomonadota bacterium]
MGQIVDDVQTLENHTMPRFLLNTCRNFTIVFLAFSLLACSTLTAQPRFVVSKDQLQQVVAKRFPLRYPVVGLLNLEVQAPEIRLLPERNRLSATMAVEASGAALNRKQSGTFEVEFALRYEVSDRTLRATALRFKRLNFPGLQPMASEMLNVYGQTLSEKALLEVVIHTLKPQDLGMADGLGMQPGSITVTEKGLVVDFVSKNQQNQ